MTPIQLAIKKSIEELLELLLNDIKEQLKLQGHYVTGKTAESLRMEIGDDYGYILGSEVVQFLNTGTRPTRVTGAQVAGLTTWWQNLKPAATVKEAKSVAFAIAKKHVAEGNPTRKSKIFSQNGKRVGAVNDAVEQSRKKVNELFNAERIAFAVLKSFVGDIES